MHHKKKVYLGNTSTEGIIKGVNTLSDAVKSTLGPKGRYVVLSHLGKVFVTKDGVTVAKNIFLEDPLEDMGAQLIKQAASKTGLVAGDGTTTSTVLAQSIINNAVELLKNPTLRYNAIDIKREIDATLPVVIEYIMKGAQAINNNYDLLEKVATISTNNDAELGKLIRQAYELVTFDGVIAVEESKQAETTVKLVEGMEFEGGYFSSYFSSDPKTLSTQYDDAYVLIVDGKITSPKNIIHILDQVMSKGKSLMIIADELDPQTLSVLTLNKVKAGLKVVAVKPPLFGTKRRDYLYDIAAITGGTVISETVGVSLSRTTLEHLGTASKIKANSRTSTIIGGGGSPEVIKKRIETLQSQLEVEATDWGKNKIKERIAKMTTGIALIQVAAITEAEMREKKDRIDDAIHACRAAIEEGCIIGGGNYLAALAHMLVNSETGVDYSDNILIKSLTTPLEVICHNAGNDFESIYKDLMSKIIEEDSFFIGYNAQTDTIENLWESGVIDPVKVVRVALENACSIAGMILTSQCAVVDTNEDYEADDSYDPELIGMS
jgi:chaperonin GroEL